VRRSRILRTSAILAGLVAAVAGCASGEVGLGPSADQREHRVAADPHATAAEVVGAGHPVDVAEAHDRTLVTYLVESDDDEGPQRGAWRLYDEAGKRLADGAFAQVREQDAIARVEPVPDGFLLRGYAGARLQHVDPNGTLSPVTVSRSAAPARPGDLLVEGSDDSGFSVYTPADRSAHRLPRIPDASGAVVLDDRGTVWLLRTWTRTRIVVAHSVGGAGPWHDLVVPSRRGDYPMGLTADGGRVVVPVAHGPDDAPRLQALEVLDAARPDAGWRAVDPHGITLRHALEPVVHVLADGRLLVGEPMEDAWLQADDGFTRVDLPDPWASIKVQGARWFATMPKGRRLWVSADEGATWSDSRLPGSG
jgi:hypothetical protein